MLDYVGVKRDIICVVVTTNKQQKNTQFDQFYLFLTTI